MRRQIIHLLLGALLTPCLLPYALAQSEEVQKTDPPTEKIGEHRSGAKADQISQSEDCRRVPESDERRCLHRRPRRVWSEGETEDPCGVWRPKRRGRHALIGAVIGFGIGAAVGAKGNKDQHTRARVVAPVLGGAVGAWIGATIGGAHPSDRFASAHCEP